MNGKISFFGCSDGSIRIEIEDKASGITFFVGEMSAEDFGRGVTGLACRPIDCRLMGIDSVGKTCEIKKVKVPYSWTLSRNFANDMQELVKPHEIDGWTAEDIQSINHHKMKGDTYEVTFRRYVESA